MFWFTIFRGQQELLGWSMLCCTLRCYWIQIHRQSWLVVVFSLIDLHLLSMVWKTHRSSVVYYWTISSSSFTSPKALRDDKTWSLHNFFTKLTIEFLVGNTRSHYHIVSMEKWAFIHVISALRAFSRNGVSCFRRENWLCYHLEFSPLLLLQEAGLFFWALSIFLWPEHKSPLR